MSSALYTISYKPTRSVVALASFEKKKLVGQAAWDQLLTTLVGAKLPISISSHDAAIEIAASDLGCDLVKPLAPLDLEAVLANPYGYRVSVEPPASATPGDGQEKLLRKAERYAIARMKLTVGRIPQVSVTLASQPPSGLTTRLLFEGRDPVLVDTTSKSNVLVFDLDAGVTITQGVSYGVMFFMEDMPVVARKLKAEQGDPAKKDQGNDSSGPSVTPSPASDPKAASDPGAKATSDSTSKATSDSTSKAASDPGAKATSDSMSKATSDSTSKATSDSASKATSDSTSKATSDSASKATSDSASKATPEDTAKAAQLIGLKGP